MFRPHLVEKQILVAKCKFVSIQQSDSWNVSRAYYMWVYVCWYVYKPNRYRLSLTISKLHMAHAHILALDFINQQFKKKMKTLTKSFPQNKPFIHFILIVLDSCFSLFILSLGECMAFKWNSKSRMKCALLFIQWRMKEWIACFAALHESIQLKQMK